MMTVIQKLSDLDLENAQEFTYNYECFKRNTKIRDAINRMFGARLKHVFCSANCELDDGDIHFSFANMICVNHQGKFIQIHSSEWGFISSLK